MHMGVYSLLFLHAVVTLSLSCSVDITTFPESQNVTSGSIAYFSCGGNGKSLTWFINETLLDQNLATSLNIAHNESLDSEDCTINSTISILGSDASNNTMVHCLLSGMGLNVEKSDKVLLRVQGVPNAVGDLEIRHDVSNSHLLSWSAPNSLHGIDTLYYVSVSDESSEGETIVKTVSDTSCNLELIACHAYTLTVVPWNKAGNGSALDLEYFYPGAPISPPVENITVSSLALNTENGLVVTTLQYPVTSMCYSYQNITIQASTSDDYGYVFSSVSQVDKSVVTVAIGGIPLNKVLSVKLVLSNDFGTAPVNGGVMIRTYNTQGVALTRDRSNKTNCFQCMFLPNSQTNGCLLKLLSVTPSSCSMTRNITLPRNNCSTSEMCFDDIYQGTYNIEVYDVLSNVNGTQLYSEHPQVLTNIGIEGNTCEPTIAVETTSTRPTDATMTVTVSMSESPVVTIGSIENDVGSIRTAAILIGVFGGVLVIIIVIMLGIFIYRKRQMQGGSLRINQSITSSVDDTKITRIPSVQGNEISQMPSFSSLGPPPYQSPPQITRDDLDQHHCAEQYIIMHSASTRSPSASNSTSSHLGLVQGSSTSHKDLTTSGHYDHLQQVAVVDDEDLPEKHPFDHVQLQKVNNDRLCFELKPFYRNEHLV